MEAAGIPLERYVNGRIYYGVKTGFNAAFVINGAKRAELIAADPRSAECIKPLVVGDDIRKWRVEIRDMWLIYSPWGLNIDEYPALKEHLRKWQPQLEARPECLAGRYKWWCMARYGAEYADAFNKPKIVFPDIGKQSRFAFDSTGVYINDTTFMICVSDLYLLGVLNCASVWTYLSQTAAVLGDASKGGRMRLKRIYMQKLPIPDAPIAERAAIESLVRKCLDAKGQGPDVAAWEAEIDARVARLYGLSDADLAAMQGARTDAPNEDDAATA